MQLRTSIPDCSRGATAQVPSILLAVVLEALRRFHDASAKSTTVPVAGRPRRHPAGLASPPIAGGTFLIPPRPAGVAEAPWGRPRIHPRSLGYHLDFTLSSP